MDSIIKGIEAAVNQGVARSTTCRKKHPPTPLAVFLRSCYHTGSTIVRKGVLHLERKEPLTAKEEKLIAMIRDLGFGEIRIHVADGQPVRAEEIKKSVKL